MAEHFAAQVGHDALAERGHKVVARGACQREQASDRDHHGEIAVDEVEALVREAEIDHAADRERHRQRGERGGHQRDDGGDRAAAVAADIGEQQDQRPELGPGALQGLPVLPRGTLGGVPGGSAVTSAPRAVARSTTFMWYAISLASLANGALRWPTMPRPTFPGNRPLRPAV